MFQTVALSGSRGERQLFFDVSVTVKPGTLLAVVGENGSGKTSFLRMLCGLLSPDKGAILCRAKTFANSRNSILPSSPMLGISTESRMN